MITYTNPAVEVLADPKGVDKVLIPVQQAVAGNAWLQKSFGRCVQQTGQTPGRDGRPARSFTFPEVYKNKEPFSLMMNDNLNSYSFIHLTGPLEFIDYDPDPLVQMASQAIAIIVWANMNKIDPAYTQSFSESLRRDVYLKLTTIRNLQLRESITQVEEVFNPFTITENFRQFTKPPYTSFRFNGTLTFDYRETCV